MTRTKKSVPLGSGLVYLAKLETDTIPAAAELVALAVDSNLVGETTGGASLSYTANIHKEQDDHGRLFRIVYTDEEAKLKTGVFSWCLDTITQLSPTARIVQDGEYEVLKIGGLQNDDGTRYIVIFKQIDPVLGDLYVAIVGTNTAGLSFAYSRTNSTKLEPEFTAQPCDNEGTLILMFEALPASTSAASSGSSTTSGDSTSG